MTAPLNPVPPDRQVGWCEGCSEPILENQPWREGEEFPGDLWHVDCLPEGGAVDG